MDSVLGVNGKVFGLVKAEESLQELQVGGVLDGLGFSLLDLEARIVNQNLFSSFKDVFPSLDFSELVASLGF
jgi:hypothetical protein